ncbi:MAG: FAD/NAD(P)-binding protein [Gammaproteobacteria bacterium]|nr:FAD/NAD(P)-binding protein [Gammaproteobacteria bacterium]
MVTNPQSPYLPKTVEVVERIQETQTVFTLRLRFIDEGFSEQYRFQPGQFNMLYLYGVGEIPISIVSDPDGLPFIDHAIRVVGRVTKGMAKLKKGDRLGLRGPYGQGWPMDLARDKNLLVITGGLGCAPVVSAINYVIERRADFNKLTIMQGVKLPSDLVWRSRYEQWSQIPDTEIYLAADEGAANWPWHVGRVTELFDRMSLAPDTVAMLCGPEGMMRVCIKELVQRTIKEEFIFLSMERNMQCAVGSCGHCQFGPYFVCKDGPVFCYAKVKQLLAIKGV